MSIAVTAAEWFSKFHFIATLAMFFFIAMMVVEEEMAVRALLLVPVVLLYFLSKVMYSLDQISGEGISERHKKKR